MFSRMKAVLLKQYSAVNNTTKFLNATTGDTMTMKNINEGDTVQVNGSYSKRSFCSQGCSCVNSCKLIYAGKRAEEEESALLT